MKIIKRDSEWITETDEEHTVIVLLEGNEQSWLPAMIGNYVINNFTFVNEEFAGTVVIEKGKKTAALYAKVVYVVPEIWEEEDHETSDAEHIMFM